jgi:hypothetical protein
VGDDMSIDDKKSVQSNAKSKGVSSKSAISAFLQEVASLPVVDANAKPGRLLFALDATASRESAWDRAMSLQSEMFLAAHNAGRLEIQLSYFRGFAEFYITPWCRDSRSLIGLMTGIQCQAGTTQIERVLRHCLDEHKKCPLQCLVYIGDAMEENADVLCQLAGQCGLLNIPIFIFQEGKNHTVETVYRQMSKYSKGAYFQFDSASANQLQDLLKAVAVYASGGLAALKKLSQSTASQSAVRRLTQQLQGLE